VRQPKWLAVDPMIHYSVEAAQAKLDELHAEIEEAARHGYVYPFERYELMPVTDELVAQWDETIAARTDA
jgi:plasmid stabilization system protein ParE